MKMKVKTKIKRQNFGCIISLLPRPLHPEMLPAVSNKRCASQHQESSHLTLDLIWILKIDCSTAIPLLTAVTNVSQTLTNIECRKVELTFGSAEGSGVCSRAECKSGVCECAGGGCDGDGLMSKKRHPLS